MKKELFTTRQYLEAIQREQGKRATTYPKILAKMKKQGAEPEEYFDMILKQSQQNKHLDRIVFLIESSQNVQNWIHTDFVRESLTELIRELKERKRCYPRWVKLYRMMTQETADYEIAIWESLTRWFAKEFLELDELPTKRRKNKD